MGVTERIWVGPIFLFHLSVQEVWLLMLDNRAVSNYRY